MICNVCIHSRWTVSSLLVQRNRYRMYKRQTIYVVSNSTFLWQGKSSVLFSTYTRKWNAMNCFFLPMILPAMINWSRDGDLLLKVSHPSDLDKLILCFYYFIDIIFIIVITIIITDFFFLFFFFCDKYFVLVS